MSDSDNLAALGVDSHFDRTMSTWENFALGFAYLSPVVGVYSLFDSSLHAGGAPVIWSYLIAAAGQFLVCLVFGEVVSQFPIAGGVYPWARRLVGRKWAWMTAWIYVWALFVTIASVATGAGPFLTLLLGFPSTPTFVTIVAVGLIVLSTILNLSGTRLLAKVAMFGFICELVGALLVGGYLLTFGRVHGLEVLVDPMNASVNGSYLPAFLAASLLGLYCCYGFEACGDVAEEVKDPGHHIPKAMRMTIYIGMSASIFAFLALVLAVPDIRAVISGDAPTPLADILQANFGAWGARGVAAVVMVSFIACALSLQAAVSRIVYSFARDDMVFASKSLAALSENHVPKNALFLAGLIPGAIVLIGLVVSNALTVIVSFAVVGIYLAFQMVVAGAIHARLQGWEPSGAFTLKGWSWPVLIGAQAYGIAAITNMLWPRATTGIWYIDYAMALGLAAVLAVGGIYLVVGKPHTKGNAPFADAWNLFPKR